MIVVFHHLPKKEPQQTIGFRNAQPSTAPLAVTPPVQPAVAITAEADEKPQNRSPLPASAPPPPAQTSYDRLRNEAQVQRVTSGIGRPKYIIRMKGDMLFFSFETIKDGKTYKAGVEMAVNEGDYFSIFYNISLKRFTMGALSLGPIVSENANGKNILYIAKSRAELGYNHQKNSASG